MKTKTFIYSLVWVTSKPGFWVPTLYFFLVQNKNLEPSLALVLLGSMSLLTALLEVPTGVIADRVSRKLSIQLGIFFDLLGFIGLLFAPSVLFVFVSIVLRSIGVSLGSGADYSLLYDMLRENGEEAQFKPISRRTKAYHMMQVVLTTFLAGIITPFGLEYTIVATIALEFIGFLFSFLLKDVDLSQFGEELVQQNYINHFFESMKLVLSKKALLSGMTMLTIGASIMTAFSSSNKNIYSPILEKFSSDLALIGFIVSFIYFVKMMGYLLPISKIDKLFPRHSSVPFLFIVYGLLYFSVVFSPNIYITGTLIALAIGVEGMYVPTIIQIYNDEIPSTYRSTLLSFQSLLEELISLLFLAVFGILITKQNIEISMIWVISLVILGSVFVSWFLSKNKINV